MPVIFASAAQKDKGGAVRKQLRPVGAGRGPASGAHAVGRVEGASLSISCLRLGSIFLGEGAGAMPLPISWKKELSYAWTRRHGTRSEKWRKNNKSRGGAILHSWTGPVLGARGRHLKHRLSTSSNDSRHCFCSVFSVSPCLRVRIKEIWVTIWVERMPCVDFVTE